MSELCAARPPRPALQEPARQRSSAPSACTTCRTRKVKCDRILPHCTACSNHPKKCKYEEKRKRNSSRSTYKNMADRLAKMESIVKMSSGGKAATLSGNQFIEFDSRPDPNTLPNRQENSSDPFFDLMFEEDELISPPRTAINEDGQSVLAGHKPYHSNNSVNNALNVEYTGSFCIFSPRGVQWIDKLVGDESFAQAVSALRLPTPPANNAIVGLSSFHALPSKSNTIECVIDYLAGLNCVVHLFDDQEIMDGIERYHLTGKAPSRSWFLAVNVILAHAFQKRSGPEDAMRCQKYIANAMSMIPSMLVLEPNALSSGAMLSMVIYFAFLPQNQTAIMILGAVVQLMILDGYHTTRGRPGQTDMDKLRKRRLFYQAFILDHDLALHVGKPPIISLDLVSDLPDESPEDGVGTVMFDDGTTLNILRKQVTLARIKSKLYSLLYAKSACRRHAHEDAKIISDLDSELYAWKANIPDLSRSNGLEKDNKDSGSICLTILHYRYYQVLIVLHSFVFQSPSLIESDEGFRAMLSSVALCVGAARATISLLDFHKDGHPFSVHLLNGVSWSLDIVFINSLQHKGDVSAQEDLALLRKVISLFERHDPNYKNSISFRIADIFYHVAWKAHQNYAFSQTPPPNRVLLPADLPLSKAWTIKGESKTVPYKAPGSKQLESSQIPLYDETTTAHSSNYLLHHQYTDISGSGIADQFPDLRLDDDLMPTSSHMACTGHNQGVINNEWRFSFNSDPQRWEGVWTTAAIPGEEVSYAQV